MKTITALEVLATNAIALVILVLMIRGRHTLARLYDLLAPDNEGHTELERHRETLTNHEIRIKVLESKHDRQ